MNSAHILLVEDNDAEAELATRALRKGNVMNKLLRVRDGVEALEFVFREGPFSQRRGEQPRLILLDLHKAVPRPLIRDNEVMAACFSGDGRFLVCYSLGGRVVLGRQVQGDG